MARFTSENQPKKRGRHKGPTATDWLRRLSHTKISFQNPLTGKVEKEEINMVVAIQLILKATQDSDLPSIREYLDRLDGKVPQKLIGEGMAQETKVIVVYPQEFKPKEERIADKAQVISSGL